MLIKLARATKVLWWLWRVTSRLVFYFPVVGEILQYLGWAEILHLSSCFITIIFCVVARNFKTSNLSCGEMLQKLRIPGFVAKCFITRTCASKWFKSKHTWVVVKCFKTKNTWNTWVLTKCFEKSYTWVVARYFMMSSYACSILISSLICSGNRQATATFPFFSGSLTILHTFITYYTFVKRKW